MKTTTKRIMKAFVASALTVGLAMMANLADAGRGGSYSAVDSAIRANGADAIISVLEQSERLVCPACVEPVLGLLEHDDYRVREVAAWWFSKRHGIAKQLTGQAITTLGSGDSIAVRNAADMVGTFRNPQVLPDLMGALDRASLNPEARLAVTRALGTIGHDAANPAIERSMQDPDALVRYEALTAWQGIRHQRHADAAVVLLGDSDTKVRRQATALMGVYKMDDARTALEAQLQDSDPGVRRNAAWSLGQLGDAQSRAALLAATADESGLVRLVAQRAMDNLR